MEISRSFGYLREAEVEFLISLSEIICSEIEMPVCVNIGIGTGTSSLALREGCTHAKMYSVDIREGGPLGGLKNERNAYEGTKLKLPTQILSDSVALGKRWGKEKIDLLFIDDKHAYDHVIEEIKVWLPHINDNGIIAFHDYTSNNWPGVRQAVDEAMSEYKEIGLIDTLVAFRKVKKDVKI